MRINKVVTNYGETLIETYDNNNNLIKKDYPLGVWWQWKYDKNNNVIERTTSNGYWVKYTYDENNRLIKKEYVDGYVWKSNKL